VQVTLAALCVVSARNFLSKVEKLKLFFGQRNGSGQRRNEEGKGAQCPGRRITGGRPNVPTMTQVLSSIQYLYSQNTLCSNMGGGKLVSCLWRHGI